jgi:8-oxo-dGTP diphosphatase
MSDIRFMEGDKQLFGLTVDAVIIRDNKVLLMKRTTYPFEGSWVIPGGYVELDETLEEACVREAKEETGLDVTIQKTIGAYSKLGRDPRGRLITVAYLCYGDGEPKTNYESSELRFFSEDELKALDIGFDHKDILKDTFRILEGR